MNQASPTAVPPRNAASPKSTWVQSSTRPQGEKRAADLGTLGLGGCPQMTVTHLSGSQRLSDAATLKQQDPSPWKPLPKASPA